MKREAGKVLDKTNTQEKRNIVTVKLDITWYYAFQNLDDLCNYPILMEDNEFRHAFNCLFDYVSSKLETHVGEIIDTYMVIEKEIR